MKPIALFTMIIGMFLVGCQSISDKSHTNAYPKTYHGSHIYDHLSFWKSEAPPEFDLTLLSPFSTQYAVNIHINTSLKLDATKQGYLPKIDVFLQIPLPDLHGENPDPYIATKLVEVLRSVMENYFIDIRFICHSVMNQDLSKAVKTWGEFSEMLGRIGKECDTSVDPNKKILILRILSESPDVIDIDCHYHSFLKQIKYYFSYNSSHVLEALRIHFQDATDVVEIVYGIRELERMVWNLMIPRDHFRMPNKVFFCQFDPNDDVNHDWMMWYRMTDAHRSFKTNENEYY